MRKGVKDNEELFQDQNVKVISSYLDFAKKYGGKYYIGGQIVAHPDDNITYNNIEKAKKINENAVVCHQMDYFSLVRSKQEIIDLEKILEIYFKDYINY